MTAFTQNWELSADRANASRRFMEANRLRPDQVKQIRGFADQQLRKPEDPENPGNRRISLIVQYLRAPEKPVEKAEKKEIAEAHTSHR